MPTDPWAEEVAQFARERAQRRKRDAARKRAQRAEAKHIVEQMRAANRQGAPFAFPLRRTFMAEQPPVPESAKELPKDFLAVRRTGPGRPRKV